jgi:hypothetical protein
VATRVRDGKARIVKKFAFGFGVIALYVIAVAVSRVPVRPLYDGGPATLPYNWVKPPSGFKNTKPTAHSQDVDIGGKGSVGANVSTTDGQANLIMPEGSFAKHADDKSVRIRFVPLDPAKITPPAKPSAQGNAYAITAKYEPSGSEAVPAHVLTVLLRYPASALTMLRLDGNHWTRLKAQDLSSSLQIYANTNKLGTFVAAGGRNNTKILWYITGAISFVAASLGLILGLRERRAGPRSSRN